MAPYSTMVRDLFCMRDGDIKFNHCPADPLHSLNFVSDLDEMQSFANEPVDTYKMAHFNDYKNSRWDLEKFDVEFRGSEVQRNIAYAALRSEMLLFIGSSAAFICG